LIDSVKESGMKYSNIVFVCTGNTCRSAMAEALFKDLLRRQNGAQDHIKVSSAGTTAYKNYPASDLAITVLQKRGIDISRHQTQPVTQENYDRADLVLCMTAEHAAQVRGLFPGSHHKVFLLTEFCGGSGDIEDPSGKPPATYEGCARLIENLVKTLWERIR